MPDYQHLPCTATFEEKELSVSRNAMYNAWLAQGLHVPRVATAHSGNTIFSDL